MVRRDFAEECAEEHEALIAALLDACAYCDRPENHATIAEILSQRAFVNCPPQDLFPALSGKLDFGHGRSKSVEDFLVFNRRSANEPSADKAAWITNHVRLAKLATAAELTPALARSVFRCDIYDRASALRASNQKPNENRKTKLEPALS